MWKLNDGQLTTPKHDEMVLELLDPIYIKRLLLKYVVGGFNPSFLDKDEFESVVKIESEVPIVSGYNRFIIGYWDVVVTIEDLFLLPEGIWVYKERGNIQATHVDKHPKFRIFIEVKPTIRSFGETLRQLNTHREYVNIDSKYTHVCLYTNDTTFKREFESQGITVLTPLSNEVKYTETENDTNESEEVTSDKSEITTDWYDKAKELFVLEKYDETIQALDKALELDSQNANSWYYKGKALYSLGRYDEALHAYNKVIELQPKSGEYVDAWYNKGVTLRKLNRCDEALQAFDKVIELDPTSAKAWRVYDKIIELQKRGKSKEAIESVDKDKEHEPQNAREWWSKGNTLCKLNRHKEALKAYDRAIELNAQNSYAWFFKGTALRKMGRYGEALKAYNKVIELDPRSAENLQIYDKVIELQKLARYEEVIEAPRNKQKWWKLW